nr:MAG TPA: hypothetical protein [Caudoviricetes sp.]
MIFYFNNYISLYMKIAIIFTSETSNSRITNIKQIHIFSSTS